MVRWSGVRDVAGYARTRATYNANCENHRKRASERERGLLVGRDVYVEGAKLSTYADASVVCGSLETKTVRKNGKSLGEAITNPVVIVEVLSDSTERYDRDAKFQAYKLLNSLREYVLVAQDERRIEVYRLDAGDWKVETSGAGGHVTVHGSRLDVDSVYG